MEINRAQFVYVDFMIDIFVYTAVLNLFVEYGDAIIIDSFTVSLLAALMMKVTLGVRSAASTNANRESSPSEGRRRGTVRDGLMGSVRVGSSSINEMNRARQCMPTE